MANEPNGIGTGGSNSQSIINAGYFGINLISAFPAKFTEGICSVIPPAYSLETPGSGIVTHPLIFAKDPELAGITKSKYKV